MKKSMDHRKKTQKGSSTVEYMVLVTFIGLALITGATALQSSLNTQMVAAGEAVNNIVGGGGGTIGPRLYDPLRDTDVAFYRDAEGVDYPVLSDENGQYYLQDTEKVYLSSGTYYVKIDMTYDLKYVSKTKKGPAI